MGEHEKEATNEGCFACFTGPWKSLRAKSRKNSQNEPCTNPSGDESAIVTATVNSPSPPTNEGRPSSIGLSPAQNTQVVPPENPGYNELASPSSPPPENRKQAPPVLGLWAQAAQRLDSTERDKVEALMGSTKGIANDHVESVLSSAQNLKDGEGDYRWQPILDKIIQAALAFKSVGDSLVAFDQSGYAGLGWSVVSFGLQFVANAKDAREFVLSSSEFVTDLLVRYKEYERFRDSQGEQHFDELLVRVYKAILIYIVTLQQYLQQGSAGRTMRAGVTVENRSISAKKKAIDAADIHVKDFIIPLFFKNLLLSEPTQQSQDSQDCLNSLAFDEMNDRFENINPALKGTCEWLLGKNEYREWTQRDRGLLWVKGKPGSGKSTLLRYALGHGLLESEVRERAYTQVREAVGQGPTTSREHSCDDRSVIFLSFFFHGRGTDLQKTPLGFYRSILHQLLCHVQLPNGFPDGFLATFLTNRKNNGDSWRWSLSELQSFFENALQKVLNTRPVWLFLDALDEAGEDNAVELVQSFTSLIQKCSPAHHFRICFSCRSHLIVDDGAPKDATEIFVERNNNDDIAAFVESQLKSLDNATSEDLISMRKAIISRADGVFMWAHLVVKQVRILKRRGATSKRIKDEIAAIPDELHQLYRSLVKKLTYRSESLKVFLWVSLSQRPLSPEEFGWAMTVDIDVETSKESFDEYQEIADWDWTGDLERNLKTHSYGLVEVALSSQSRPIVQFIHQSVRDFFLVEGLSDLQRSIDGSEPKESLEGMAHHRLSKACIRYFKVEEFAQYEGQPHREAQADLRHGMEIGKFPLLNYAVSSWMLHEQESERTGTSQNDLLAYFGWPSQAVFQRWKWLCEAIQPPEVPDLYKCRTIFHVASIYGLTGTLRMALQSSDRIQRNALDSTRDTPLCCAAKAGHKDVVRLLLQMGADVNALAFSGISTLQVASMHGHLSIVELLLQNNADVNFSNQAYGDALYVASGRGHLPIVELLLRNGSDVNAQAGVYSNALQAASWGGHLPIVELLLQNGAKVNAQGGKYGSALQAAAWGGHLPLVELLLRKGANVNAQGGEYGTALHAVICSYSGATLPIIDLLIQQGADANAKGKYGTALEAAEWTHSEVQESIIELLIQTTTDVDGRNAQGDN